jgi:hypothetical protein
MWTVDQMSRFLREDEGLEMLEWSIVGAVLTLAGAFFWQDLTHELSKALHQIGATRWASTLW